MGAPGRSKDTLEGVGVWSTHPGSVHESRAWWTYLVLSTSAVLYSACV